MSTGLQQHAEQPANGCLHFSCYPPHVRAHPLCRLPKGYRWVMPFEKIGPGCIFTRPGSPRWWDVHPQSSVKDYDPKAFYAHATPIEDNDQTQQLGGRQVTPAKAAKPTQTKIMNTTQSPTELAAVPSSPSQVVTLTLTDWNQLCAVMRSLTWGQQEAYRDWYDLYQRVRDRSKANSDYPHHHST